MTTSNPFIFDTSKPSKYVRPNTLSYAMLSVASQLRWKHALEECVRDGRDYTEIHFWLNFETDEFVLTYWEITP